jgi:hypothetical protein
MIELYRYRRNDGSEPFTEWLNSLRDKLAAARVRVRIRQVEAGNFGDCESVGESVIELEFISAPVIAPISVVMGNLPRCFSAEATNTRKSRTFAAPRNSGPNGREIRNELSEWRCLP